MRKDSIRFIYINNKRKITREYLAWLNMKQRCLNTKRPSYKNYGGRGIKIHWSWKYSFENFLKNMGTCPEGYSIERKNNNGNYCSNNCIWINRTKQQNNTRMNTYYKYNKKIMTLTQWCKYLKIPRTTLWNRIYRAKMSFEKAIITKPKLGRNYVQCIEAACGLRDYENNS